MEKEKRKSKLLNIHLEFGENEDVDEYPTYFVEIPINENTQEEIRKWLD